VKPSPYKKPVRRTPPRRAEVCSGLHRRSVAGSDPIEAAARQEIVSRRGRGSTRRDHSRDAIRQEKRRDRHPLARLLHDRDTNSRKNRRACEQRRSLRFSPSSACRRGAVARALVGRRRRTLDKSRMSTPVDRNPTKRHGPRCATAIVGIGTIMNAEDIARAEGSAHVWLSSRRHARLR